MTAAANTQSSAYCAHCAYCGDEVTRVADMLDLLAAGDVTLTISGLEDLLTKLRQAEIARGLLTSVDRDTVKAALVLRRQRQAGGTE